MTTAEKCRNAEDPFVTAGHYAVFVSRVSDYRIVFHFEDHSFLVFNIAYAVDTVGEGFL